ncbi:MAG: hypothetical protein LBE32_00425 [Burkholderiales bacterium]|jgi:hypothetical protein|nr:hypothetical protein [Burkholderiales bacterium]
MYNLFGVTDPISRIENMEMALNGIAAALVAGCEGYPGFTFGKNDLEGLATLVLMINVGLDESRKQLEKHK